jgi:hypothetical protein
VGAHHNHLPQHDLGRKHWYKAAIMLISVNAAGTATARQCGQPDQIGWLALRRDGGATAGRSRFGTSAFQLKPIVIAGAERSSQIRTDIPNPTMAMLASRATVTIGGAVCAIYRRVHHRLQAGTNGIALACV